jgi:hypothetical protein
LRKYKRPEGTDIHQKYSALQQNAPLLQCYLSQADAAHNLDGHSEFWM